MHRWSFAHIRKSPYDVGSSEIPVIRGLESVGASFVSGMESGRAHIEIVLESEGGTFKNLQAKKGHLT